MGPMTLLLFPYSGFLCPSTPARFESANLGSSGEYDNHWTTGVYDMVEEETWNDQNKVEAFVQHSNPPIIGDTILHEEE